MAGDVSFSVIGDKVLRDAVGRFRRVDTGKVLDEMIVAWARDAVATLREATPVEEDRPDWRSPRPVPGTARRSWRYDHLPAQKSVVVRNDQPYVPFLVRGTDPHRIEPKTPGGYLVFFWKKMNRWARPPYVMHPGTKPVPALEAAIERLEQTAAVDLHQAGVEILQEIAGMHGGT